jgi:hypothetical protein
MTPKLHLIAVEVSAELWTAAIAKSQLNKDDLDAVVVLGLERYVSEDR